MWEWLIPVIIVVALILVVGIYLWATYNSLVALNVRVDEAWSDITVQLKRRADLLPNLIETVKGYAAHEKAVFENVTRARAETLSAGGPAEAGVAEGHMQQALKSLFAVAEAYPALQASQNFLQLQQSIVDTEDKVQASRRFYNGGVRELNTKIKVLPNNLFARNLGFNEREFFEVVDGAAISEPPRVGHRAGEVAGRIAPPRDRDVVEPLPARGEPQLVGEAGRGICRSSVLPPRRLDQERRGPAIRLEVDTAHEVVADEDGQGVVAEPALRRGRVDLDAVLEAEETLGPVAEPHHRIEGREDGGGVDAAGESRIAVHPCLGRPTGARPPGDFYGLQFAAALEIGDRGDDSGPIPNAPVVGEV